MLDFLRAHPVVCLLLLTPGIPEYISTSSSPAGIIIAPAAFLVFLALNLGLYGPGVLLIREARIRWRKGWATVILLAAAYGVLEEGVALSTLFDPRSPVVAGLGLYGHFAGVSWVWLTGVIMVHVVFSISIPILLLGLALPETRNRSLLSPRGVRWSAAIWVVDILVLMAIVAFGEHFWMGLPILLGSFAAIGGLILAARYAPVDLVRGPPGPPRIAPWAYFVLGVSLFYATLFVQAGFGYANVPAAVTVVVVAEVLAAYFVVAGSGIGSWGNERQLIAFCAGAVVSVMMFGLLASLRLPVVAVLDAVALAFFLWLWRKYSGALPGPAPQDRSSRAPGRSPTGSEALRAPERRGPEEGHGGPPVSI